MRSQIKGELTDFFLNIVIEMLFYLYKKKPWLHFQQ